MLSEEKAGSDGDEKERQLFLEFLECQMKMVFDCFLRQAEQFRDFIVALALNAVENEHLTTFRRHILDYLIYCSLSLPRDEIIFEGVVSGEESPSKDIVSQNHRGLPADVVNHRVLGNLEQVVSEIADFRQNPAPRPDLDEHLLRDVLRRIHIFQDKIRELLCLPIIFRKNIMESPHIPLCNLPYVLVSHQSLCSTDAKVIIYVNYPIE